MGGVTMARRKAPVRRKPLQIQVRVTEKLKADVEAMMDRLESAVINLNEDPLTRTDLANYWLRWLLSLSHDEQARWAETYRETVAEAIRGGVRPHLSPPDLGVPGPVARPVPRPAWLPAHASALLSAEGCHAAPNPGSPAVIF